ncbi:MAG: SCP2 sterol-binding domain-containing protein [bacterium]|nr:SCP2 sterol-binding domain-containing protein [bacterium]
MTVKEIFEEIEKRLAANPAKIQGLNAVFQFTLSGAEAGTWQVKTEGGKAEFSEGTPHTPGVTIVMSSEDFKEMVGGKLNPTQAFMTGRLKLQGDMGLAMKLQNVLM